MPWTRKKKKSCKFVFDPFCVSMMRRVLQNFYDNHHYPNVTSMWKKCREDLNFPPVGRTTFYQWLIRKCKFKYKKVNKKPVLLERQDIVASREKYLRNIKQYRDQNYEIFYSDETWTSPDQTRSRCWHMHVTDEEMKDMSVVGAPSQPLRDMDGFVGGFLLKSAAGRVIINHIGSEKGFLVGGDDIFICKRDSKNYHNSMDWERYSSWFKKVLECIPDKSVIVVDMAPYHRKRVEGTVMPKMSWLKNTIIHWLEQNNVSKPTDVKSFNLLTKASLIELSKMYPVEPKYVIEDLAEKCGKDVKILWLPPAHCEFNAIELIWAQVKSFVAKHNQGNNNVQGILELSKKALAEVTSKNWEKCIEHVKKYENAMWKRDKLVDSLEIVNSNQSPIIIPIADDSSSESDSLCSDVEIEDNFE